MTDEEAPKPTDDEIRAMPTALIEDFINWRAFAGRPEYGWLDAIEFENDAFVDALLELEPPPIVYSEADIAFCSWWMENEALLSR